MTSRRSFISAITALLVWRQLPKPDYAKELNDAIAALTLGNPHSGRFIHITWMDRDEHMADGYKSVPIKEAWEIRTDDGRSVRVSEGAFWYGVDHLL